MDVSIIIPTKNVELEIAACLSSIENAQIENSEILVIDSCSTDKTCEIAEKWKEKLPIKLVSEKDQGVYDAFNKGARLAKGRFVYFMGADDRLLSDFTKAVTNLINENVIYVGSILSCGAVESWRPVISGVRLLYRNIPHQAMIIPRRLMLRFPFDLRYPVLADYEWNLRMFWRQSTLAKYEFHDLLVCHWASGGISQRVKDIPFKQIKATLVAEYAPIHVRAFYKIMRSLRLLTSCILAVSKKNTSSAD